MSAADLHAGAPGIRGPELPYSPEPLIDADAVAERLGVPKTWVYAEARAGRLPCVQLGRYKRFRWSSISSWLTDLEAGPNPYRRYVPGRAPGGSAK